VKKLLLSIIAISLLALNAPAQVKLDYSYFPAPAKATKVFKSEAQSFMVDTVLRGLNGSWSMEFLPDKTMLITQQGGTLLKIRNGIKEDITGNIPKNLRDVKLHPQFAKNGMIYLSYYSDPIKVGNPQPGYSVLMQAKLEGNNLVNQKIIYKAGPFNDGQVTYGSKIEFDKAGYLYFTVGERIVDERNQRLTVQDMSTTSGKILRLNDDGSIPMDNPFVRTRGALPEIYSVGHRNPQGLTMHPITGEIWESEHGEMGGDEVNILKPGANYGWPLVTYSINYDKTFISRDTKREGFEPPVNYWIPSIGPSGFDFVHGNIYPRWNGNLFIGGLAPDMPNDHRTPGLNRVVFKDGKSVHKEWVLSSGRTRDVGLAPDGFLYVLMERPGILVRLIPVD
jgi:glucose/arabinose dehydrogenase